MFESIAALFCALAIAHVGYTLAVILAHTWADQWYDADGSAHHCEECGSVFLGERVTGDLDGLPCEIRTECQDCGADCGFWAYGAVDPVYRAECIADILTWFKWAGPLLAVGVALLWSI